MDQIRELLVQADLDPGLAWLIIVLVVVQLALQVAALIDLGRRSHVTLGDRKWAWALIILLGELIGAILYFAIGRVKAAPDEKPRPLVDMNVADQKAQAIVDRLYGKGDGK